ncbi:unnamed protein product [Alopecurus aequalis]
MAHFPAVLPPLAVVDGARKKRAGIPNLLHKFFFKVLRLRPASSSSAAEPGAAAFEAYYSCGGSSWAGVLFSIPEEESSEEGTPDAVVRPGPSALRKAHSDSERFIATEAAAVVRVEVVL